MDMNKVEQEVKNIISKYLTEKFGFCFNDLYTYSFKNLEIGTDFVTYSVRKHKEKFHFSYGYKRRYSLIEEIWDDFLPAIEPKANQNPITLSISQDDFVNSFTNNSLSEQSYFPINQNGIKKSIDLFINNFELKIIPFLPTTLNINWLDKYANHPIDLTPTKTKFISSRGFFFRKMIIAKLAGNPHYEEICIWVRNRFYNASIKQPEKDYDKQVIVIDKIYERLKNVSPLKNSTL